jgi:hypothetical protein
MSDDFFIRLERQLEAAELRELNRGPVLRRFVSAWRFVSPRRLLSVPLAAAAAVGVVVVALVAVVLAVAWESDVERPATPPGKKVVVTDVGLDLDRGMRFGLDGRVLTVQLLPNRINQTFETVEGARISATCGAPPGDPRRETTVTRRWPDGQTSTSYRFPRDVSSWCRLEDQSGSILASVRFPGPGVPSRLLPSSSAGARELITVTAINWAQLIASSPQTCNDYMGQTACEQIKCQRAGGTPIPDCRPIEPHWAATFRDAMVQTIAISGDRAAATLSNHSIVQLRRTATGEWLIDKLGPVGLPAELRRKVMRSYGGS